MKKRFVKWMAGLLAAASLMINAIPVAAVPVKAEGPDIFGEMYCLMNADTGEVICEKNMDQRAYPASTTKIMTSWVTVEEVADQNEFLVYSDNAINGISIHSSTLTPKAMVGEQMTVKDTLRGLMLASGNECGVALAEHVAGSVSAFSDLMNAKAKEAGAVNTHFSNPHGLHEDTHYTTVYDMALIMKEAMKNEDFLTIASTGKYTIPKTNLCEARGLSNGHMMVSGDYAYPYAIAGKTGQTKEAGRTLVTAAEKDGVTLICVVFKSTHAKIWKDTQMLFDYGFDLEAGSIEPVEWKPVNTTWTVKSNVNVREFASTTSDVVGSLEGGAGVMCLASWGDWMKVSYAGGTYYVNMDFLTDPAAPPETQPGTPAQTESSADATEPSQGEDMTEEPSAESPEETESSTEEQKEPAADTGEKGGGHVWILWTMAIVALLLAAAVTWFTILWVRENFF